MITSMTGFGAAEGAVGAWRLTVEIRSVNHRFFTPAIKLPGVLARWEGEVRELLRKRIARGHVTLSAWLNREEDSAVGIDEERFGAYVAQLRGLRDRFQLAGDVDVATVVRLPDVVTTRRPEDEAFDATELLGVVGEACEALEGMRRSEGERIADYLRERLSVIASALDRIAERAPARLAEQQRRMRESIAELAAGVAVDPQRVAQEVAVLADRIDVAEELSRFRSHVAAFLTALDAPAGEAVGKRLGFVLQEMLREANTTGSKANDAPMLADVVLIKEELERLREQVENVE